eukprot:UC1_evm1s398
MDLPRGPNRPLPLPATHFSPPFSPKSVRKLPLIELPLAAASEANDDPTFAADTRTSSAGGAFAGNNRDSSTAQATAPPTARWVYEFPANTAGSVFILADAWSAPDAVGTIRLEYCEALLDSPSGTTCLRQHGYETTGTVDEHIIGPPGAAHGGHLLATSFSWTGYQFVIVTTTGGARFRGGLDDLQGRWSGLDLEASGNISFGAEQQQGALRASAAAASASAAVGVLSAT